MDRKNGFFKTANGKIWYEIVGKKRKTPLLVLHGGPGYPHDYLESLDDLADDRQIIFYDQLGCGNSDKTSDLSLWTVEYFTKEVQQIIEFLQLEHYHILGQSWGSALAVAFALTKPKGLKSLILADPYISTEEWNQETKRLALTLSEGYKIFDDSFKNTQEYEKISEEYYKEFVYRMETVPQPMKRSDKKFNYDIYKHLWGDDEFLITGTLKDFTQTDRLKEILKPVLLICGRYDEATPEVVEYFKNLFPNAQSIIFENSAHFPHWNEREKYMNAVKNFFDNVEKENVFN